MSAVVVVQHLSAEAAAETVAEGQAEPHEPDPELAHWLAAPLEKGGPNEGAYEDNPQGVREAKTQDAVGQGGRSQVNESEQMRLGQTMLEHWRRDEGAW